jgi:hypothetical protein
MNRDLKGGGGGGEEWINKELKSRRANKAERWNETERGGKVRRAWVSEWIDGELKSRRAKGGKVK